MSMLSFPVVISHRSSGIGSLPGTGTGTAGTVVVDGKTVAVDQFGADALWGGKSPSARTRSTFALLQHVEAHSYRHGDA